jgi:integrase/recombinase XerC/integrase/recombinase XerD
MQNTTLPTVTATTLQAPVRLHELTEQFLASHDVAAKSKETYRRSLKQFYTYLSDENQEQPTRNVILAYKNHLVDRKLSAYTVSAYVIALRKLFQWTESVGIYPNIASSIKGQKKPKGFRKDALTVKQANELLGSMGKIGIIGRRDYALVNLLIRTGLRTIEIERADIEDIRQQGGEAVLYIQGKGRDSKDEIVVLTSETLTPLREYLRLRHKPKDSDPLFISHSDRNQNQRLTTRSISRVVKTHLAEAKLDSSRLTAHSLRHSAVTFALMGGSTIQEAQSLARHASINTTLIYAHNLDRLGKAPERRIDALLGGCA